MQQTTEISRIYTNQQTETHLFIIPIKKSIIQLSN